VTSHLGPPDLTITDDSSSTTGSVVGRHRRTRL